MLNKQHLRNSMREKRVALSRDVVLAYSKGVWNRIYKLPEFEMAHSIFVYSPIGNEVHTKEIVEVAQANHKKVAYPRTNRDTYTMEFYYIQDLSELIKIKWGKFTLLEPPNNPLNKAIPDNRTLIIVPGLAFDHQMHRIGYGGGFYDKYLGKHTSSTTVGVCYDFQIVSDTFPEPHDKPLDYIVTPMRQVVND